MAKLVLTNAFISIGGTDVSSSVASVHCSTSSSSAFEAQSKPAPNDASSFRMAGSGLHFTA